MMINLPPRPEASGLGGAHRLVGRESALTDLRIRIGQTDLLAVTATANALTMHGAGGIGKSALASEYCHRFAAEDGFDLIWWVNAESDDTTAASFSELVRRSGEDPEPDIRVQVDRLLSGRTRWLAVFDNVSDRQALDAWRPGATNGSLLVTSRSSQGWPADATMPIDLIADDDAHQWLHQAAGEPSGTDQLAAIDELVAELGGLALALSMAAAFIHNTPVAPSRYRSLLAENPADVLDNKGVDLGDYDGTVYSALAVTRHQMREEDAGAAIRMLEYSAFYASDDIPMFLFTPESLGVASEIGVLNARRALAQRSIITPVGEDAFAIHRLVQGVTRHNLANPAAETDELENPVTTAGKDADTVLIVTANSAEKPLNLEEEVRVIKHELRVSSNLRAEYCPAARVDDLIADIRSARPRIVHFCGHGSTEGIALKTPDGTETHLVSDGDLQQFFRDRDVEMVVLNACHSLSQAKAISAVVATVVTTPLEIGDSAATAFSRGFYASLAAGSTVAAAFKDGQDTMNLDGHREFFVLLGDGEATFA